MFNFPLPLPILSSQRSSVISALKSLMHLIFYFGLLNINIFKEQQQMMLDITKRSSGRLGREKTNET